CRPSRASCAARCRSRQRFPPSPPPQAFSAKKRHRATPARNSMSDSVQPPRSPQPAGAPPPRPASQKPASESEIHILDRLAIVYRYRQVAFAVFVLTAAALMIQGYSNVKLYQAQARLLIEDERSTAMPGINANNNTYYEDPEPYYKTQYRILKGR